MESRDEGNNLPDLVEDVASASGFKSPTASSKEKLHRSLHQLEIDLGRVKELLKVGINLLDRNVPTYVDSLTLTCFGRLTGGF